jgi:hypothetical protein
MREDGMREDGMREDGMREDGMGEDGMGEDADSWGQKTQTDDARRKRKWVLDRSRQALIVFRRGYTFTIWSECHVVVGPIVIHVLCWLET